MSRSAIITKLIIISDVGDTKLRPREIRCSGSLREQRISSRSAAELHSGAAGASGKHAFGVPWACRAQTEAGLGRPSLHWGQPALRQSRRWEMEAASGLRLAAGVDGSSSKNVLSWRGGSAQKQAELRGQRARVSIQCNRAEGSSSAPATERCSSLVSGLEELAASGKYDAWILDQFGVLHDGKKAYPEAISALQSLAGSSDKVKIVLLSNSSRPTKVTRDKLPKLGFNPDLFHGIITSGELTHRSLLQREDPWFQALGRKCIHMTWTSRGGVSLDGLELEVVESVEEADFVLAHGTEGLGRPDGSVRPVSMEELEAILKEASTHAKQTGKKLPLIVANPDFVTVEERSLRVMPGTLGKLYAELGGEVKCMGKPDPIVFHEATRMTGVSPARTIMVGDSLHHDVSGASQAGIDSLFICGGIHAKDVGMLDNSSMPNREKVQVLFEKERALPTFYCSMFQW